MFIYLFVDPISKPFFPSLVQHWCADYVPDRRYIPADCASVRRAPGHRHGPTARSHGSARLRHWRALEKQAQGRPGLHT